MIAWSLFAFGGVYLWAVWPLVAASALLVLLARPTFLPVLRGFRVDCDDPVSADLRRLDLVLLIVLAWCGLVLVPLPWRLLDVLSPRLSATVSALSLNRSAYHPLSIDPAASLHAGMVVLVAALTFWSMRAVFRHGGIRTVARAVAFFGLIAAAIGILQDASRTRLVYWRWAPLTDGPAGFGPFINRNHFATWALMALALTAGYVFARTDVRDEQDRFRSFMSRLRRKFDVRTVWLLCSLALLGTAFVLTLSRSGLAGGAVALVAGRLIGARRGLRLRGWLYATATVLIVFAILWTGPTTLAGRWGSTDIGQEGRSAIWRETMPVVRDFWVTGTGVGTYGSAMRIYQRTDRTVHFNQAHNQYLQVMAEGGIVLSFLAALAAGLFIATAAERIRGDHTGMLWLRIGAACGLAGVAMQSVWETGVRMPGNAVLAAVLAAVLLHEPDRRLHHPHRSAPQ